MYRTRNPRALRYHCQPHGAQHPYYYQQPPQQDVTSSLVSGWFTGKSAGALTSTAGAVAARDRPDSFADLIYNLQQAASCSQMGSHSSKDLRASGAVLAAAATPASTQHAHAQHHRQKKSSSRSHHRDTDNPSPSHHHHHQPSSSSATDHTQPVVAVTSNTRAGPSRGRFHAASAAAADDDEDDDEETDDVNRGRNNVVVLSSLPGSAAQRQPQVPSLQRLVTPSSASAAVAHGIKVVRLKVAIDKRMTVVDERSPAVLKYKTPHFRALATVEVPPLLAGQQIQIGWIQVCRDMTFINSYGREGITSWEFPEIVVGKYRMISDADGKQYPWYGSKTEVQTLQGPTLQPTHVTIHMNDNFFPQVTWYIPHSDYSREPSLEFIYRKQRFYTFLALRDLNTNVYQILKTVAWMMELSIQVEPSNPLGERSKVLGPVEQERPYVLDDLSGVRLEKYALSPPNANNSQVLVWRPRNGDPKVVVPPVQTTIDVNRYLAATRDHYSKLRRQLHANTSYAAAKSSKSHR